MGTDVDPPSQPSAPAAVAAASEVAERSPDPSRPPTRASRDTAQYLTDRVAYKINQYNRKGIRYRNMYYLLSGVALSLGALVPALINLSLPQWIPTLASVAVATLIALEGLIHPREQWRNYSLITASLVEEEMRFSTGVRPYKGDPAADLRVLVDRVERLIAAERAETIVMRTSPGSSREPRAGNDSSPS
jgi:hypothetical protein